MHRHASTHSCRCSAPQARKGNKQERGTPSWSSNGGSAGAENEETEESKGCKEDMRIVYENDKNKGTSHVQDDVVKLMHHDEKELLSLWEGRHWHEHKGGWLDPELCAKARRVEVGVHSSPQDAHQSSERDAHQDRMGGD